MQVHRNLESLPAFKNAVITIGTFDSVHTGHQQIISQLKQEAASIGGETIIITFHPHPKKVIGSSKPVKLITTLDEKIDLLEKQGIDHLVVVPFTTSFSQISAEAYIKDFLIGKFHPHTVIIGYDHKFGHDRRGDYHMMEDFAGKLNYDLKEIPEHIVDSLIVSSTKIREAISKGDMVTANDLLGYDFFFQGKVVEGNKLGRQLGYPTANIEIGDQEKIIPSNGVYAVRALHNGKKYDGMMNIGIRPTLTDGLFMIEVNMFDFDEEIYGDELRVYVKKYLREEIKFPDLDTLKDQIENDKKRTLFELRRQ
ncbi:MAG TPA: bifunctional riboflavin kinase/FAD synthetase [Chitinophagaceae bacterium]|nr:bifunctional riboflavin kinase/FAD synthetase [Chitinophagaceae bacterium]